MKNLDDDFKKMYAELGLIDDNRQSLPLHLFCMNRLECWLSAQDRFPSDNDQWSHISRPWVGYSSSAILLLRTLNSSGDIFFSLFCGFV